MVAVVLMRGSAWSPGLPLAEQSGFEEHVALVTSLLERGVAIEAGPFSDPSNVLEDDLVALALLDVGSVAEAKALFASDPMLGEEVVSLHIHPWGSAPLRRGDESD